MLLEVSNRYPLPCWLVLDVAVSLDDVDLEESTLSLIDLNAWGLRIQVLARDDQRIVSLYCIYLFAHLHPT